MEFGSHSANNLLKIDPEKFSMLNHALIECFDNMINLAKTSAESTISSFHKIDLEGIKAACTTDEELEIDIGGITQNIISQQSEEIDLEEKIEKKNLKISLIKLKFKQLIDFAGDLPKETLDTFRSLAEMIECKIANQQKRIEYISESNEKMSSETMQMQRIVEKTIEEQILSKFENILPVNYKIKVMKKTMKLTERELNIGGLQIAIFNKSEKAKSLELEFANKKLLYKHWKSICVEVNKQNNSKVMIYRRGGNKGLPILYKFNSNKTVIGYMNNESIENCTYEDLRGSKIFGRMINGRIYGKGKLLLDSGQTFEGEQKENGTAVGQMIDGNTRVKGTYELKESETTITFVRTGYFELYINEKLTKKGRYEDKKFIGTLYSDGRVLKGSWIDGEFERVKIIEGDEVTKIIQEPEKLRSVSRKKNGELVSKYFTDSSNRIQGKAYFKTDKFEKWIKAKDGENYWIKYISDEFTYEGRIKNGEYNGKGKYSSKSYTYEGNFLNSDFHGEGIYENKLKSFTYRGNFFKSNFHGDGIYENRSKSFIYKGKFENGRFISGLYKNGDVEYNGAYNSSDEKEGFGTLKTLNISYTG